MCSPSLKPAPSNYAGAFPNQFQFHRRQASRPSDSLAACPSARAKTEPADFPPTNIAVRSLSIWIDNRPFDRSRTATTDERMTLRASRRRGGRLFPPGKVRGMTCRFGRSDRWLWIELKDTRTGFLRRMLFSVGPARRGSPRAARTREEGEETEKHDFLPPRRPCQPSKDPRVY